MKKFAAFAAALSLCFPAAGQSDPLVDLLQRRDYDRDAILRQFPSDSSPADLETRAQSDSDAPDNPQNAAPDNLFRADDENAPPEFLPFAPLPSAKSADNIALVLPTLADGIAGRAAQNFYRGCAHVAGGATISLYAFDGASGEAVRSYAAAIEQGAAAVVGPMLKKNVGALLAQYPQTSVRTLLLQPGRGEGYFAMSLDSAREAADLAALLRDRFADALVVEQAGARGAALRIAFEKQWTAAGGVAPGRFMVRDENRDWTRLFDMLKVRGEDAENADKTPQPPAVIFAAGDGDFAGKTRGFAPQQYPVFTVSTANTGANAKSPLFLENLGFMEMPWFVGLDDSLAAFDLPAVRTLPFVRQRFFVLGADACRAALRSPAWREGWAMRGLAGGWRLQNGVFVRAGTLAAYRAGRLQTL